MKLVLYLTVFVLSCPLLVNCIAVDLGDCACLCGLETNGGVFGNSLQTSIGSFADQVRGEKGDVGMPGKSGLQGPPGRPGLRGVRGPPGTSTGSSTSQLLASCLAYRNSGSSQNGIYQIKPSNFSSTFATYCDMETTGGGWTLVASIHENNINGRCNVGDLWSDDQGANGSSVSSNWENTNVFGHIESATSEDYKNSGYFNLESTDLMLWHVPNDTPPNRWSDAAFLKYYTDNNFLSNYGGNLRSLYQRYSPKHLDANLTNNAYEGVATILNAVNESAVDIRGAIPDFFLYQYDGSPSPMTSISDGGNDMYDSGNQVSIRVDEGEWKLLSYGESFTDLNIGYDVATNIYAHPFVTLWHIENRDGLKETFDLKVESGTGADNSGYLASYSGDVILDNFVLHYKTFNVYGADDPSIVEVYFSISNTQDWGSVYTVNPENFKPLQWSRETDNLMNTIRFSGFPQNIIAGYTLFSRSTFINIAESNIREALTILLRVISRFPTIEGVDCSRYNESVITPVKFSVGSEEEVMRRTPPMQKKEVTPGFIQFRAIDPDNNAFALCPGVKSAACRTASVCIGGASHSSTGAKTCGDFSGFDGLKEDNPTDFEPAGSAKSLNDLKSTIMIFTRDTNSVSQTTPPPVVVKKVKSKKSA